MVPRRDGPSAPLATDDIYTRRPIVDRSSEHILLNSLGGKWERNDLIDKTTNDRFGSTIDASLSAFLSPLRTMLSSPSGDGQSPPPIKSATGADGRRYRLLPGAVVELAHPHLETDDNGNLIRASFPDAEQAKRVLEKFYSRRGQAPDVEGLVSLAEVVTSRPTLQLNQSLDLDGLRCIAKMACNLFATHHRSLFLRDDFDPIRNFILGITHTQISETPISLISPLPHLPWCSQRFGSIDHLLACYQNDDSVFGLAVFYGAYRFRILIAKGIETGLRPVTYRVNPITSHTRKDADLDTAIALSNEPIVPTGEALSRAIEEILKYAQNPLCRFTPDVSAIVSRHWVEGEDDQRLQENMIDAIARDRAKQYVDYQLAHGLIAL